MAAIVTDDFRKNNIERFIDDVQKAPTPTWSASLSVDPGGLAKHLGILYKSKTGTNTATAPASDSTNWETATEDTGGKDYFLGIGKTEPWLPNADNTPETDNAFRVPNPTGSIIEKADIKKNLITLMKVEGTDCKRLIPQLQFETGKVYKVYNPNDPTCFDIDSGTDTRPCHTLYTDSYGNRKIYICLGNNNGGLANQNVPVMPTSANYPYGIVQNSTDKYIWCYVDYFDKEPANLFKDSATFINTTEDTGVDTKVQNVPPHGAGVSGDNTYSGTYADGRKRAAQTSAGILYGFHIDPAAKGKGYPADRKIANGTNLTAVVVGERLDGTRILGNEGVASGIKVETNANGEITNIEWDLTKAKALGYGISSVPKSTTNENWTSLSIQGGASSPLGGVREATLEIQDPNAGAGGYSDESDFEEANVQCLIAPQYGFGWSPLSDLPSYYCGISADFVGTVGDNSKAPADGSPAQFIAESLVDINFRQVSLIRDTNADMSLGEDDLDSPSATYADTALTADKAMNCLQYIQVSAASKPNDFNNLGAGAYLIQAADGGSKTPIAWIDKVSDYKASDPLDADPTTTDINESGGYRIYYHQNSDKRINQLPLKQGVNLTVYDSTGVAKGTVKADILKQGEYKQDAGDVLFVDNRAPIKRNSQQTEEVRLIIQF